MMTRMLLAAALAFCCSPTSASAETPAEAPMATRGDSDCAKARQAGRVCSLVFDGDTVSGDRVSGEGDNIAIAGPADFGNLITVRTSFRDLIIKWADDL